MPDDVLPLVMTIDDDAAGSGGESSDDEFALAAPTAMARALERDPVPTSARAAAPALRDASLDEKLRARARTFSETQPARTAREGEVRTRARRAGKAGKAAAPASAPAAAASAAPQKKDRGAASAEDGDVATFAEMRLSMPLLKGLAELGFKKPTPIQSRVIPAALCGGDLCASAQTGSGKTAAFMLPALERLLHRPRRVPATRVLVLAPTRELAAQCDSMGRALGRFTDVRFCLVVGGLASSVQEAELRSSPDVVVATPGRLIDLLRNAPTVSLDAVEILVLDEADRLLDLGFRDEVNAQL